MGKKQSFAFWKTAIRFKMIPLCLLVVVALVVLVKGVGNGQITADNLADGENLNPEATPFPGQGSPITPMIFIDGNKIYIGPKEVPLWYAEKMGYLDKVAQAEYLGETTEPVPDSEEPTGELQTNCLPTGYQVYHLVTEEENSYFVYSEEDSHFIYMENWENYCY